MTAHPELPEQVSAVERAADQIIARVSDMLAAAMGVTNPDSLERRILAYADLLEGFEPTGLIGPMGVAARLRQIVAECSGVQS